MFKWDVNCGYAFTEVEMEITGFNFFQTFVLLFPKDFPADRVVNSLWFVTILIQ